MFKDALISMNAGDGQLSLNPNFTSRQKAPWKSMSAST